MSIKIALLDTDQKVRAETDLSQSGQEDTFKKFLQRIKKELIPGETAYLEIEDSRADTITFEISQFA